MRESFPLPCLCIGTSLSTLSYHTWNSRTIQLPTITDIMGNLARAVSKILKIKNHWDAISFCWYLEKARVIISNWTAKMKKTTYFRIEESHAMKWHTKISRKRKSRKICVRPSHMICKDKCYFYTQHEIGNRTLGGIWISLWTYKSFR